MKKFSIALTLLMTPLLLLGQNKMHLKGNPIRIGVIAGYTRTVITDNIQNYDKVGSRSGTVFGITALKNVGEKFAVKTDIFFSRQGYSYEQNGDRGDKGNIMSSYVYITPSFAFKPIPLLSVFAGPQAGYLVKANCGCGNTKNQAAITEHFNKVDYGIAGGVEYSLAQIADGFSVGARYYQGLSDIVNEDATGDQVGTVRMPRYSAQNTAMKFYLGYRF